jgi:AAA domain-containing protein
MIRFITPGEWAATAATLPEAEMLLSPLVPAGGLTLLHGPPGSGKSALMWGIGNAVASGAPYLGLSVLRSEVLLLSNDMSLHALKHRWNSKFVPLFHVLCHTPFDCTKSTFKGSLEYKEIRDYIQAVGIKLVLVDALGGIHSGRSARDDEVADAACGRLREWLPDIGVLLSGHDRKKQRDKDNKFMAPTDEDFLGSVKWRANMISQVHLFPISGHRARLKHDKSQVVSTLDEGITLYIDSHGQAELWDEHRAQAANVAYADFLRELDIQDLPPGQQVAAIAKHTGKTERTIWRMRKAAV